MTPQSSRRRVLIVAALEFELKPVRDALTGRAFSGREGVEYLFVANGPGPRLARQAVESAGLTTAFDAVVSVGLCGALEEQMDVGCIVVGHTVNGVPIQEPRAGGEMFRWHGPIASIDYVAGTVEEKQRLRKTGAIAVEMEAAAVLEKAREAGRPFYAVKAVSDRADEEFKLDLNAARDTKGRFSTSRILAQALRSPREGLPELARLKRNGECAAKALGDFLVHCSF
jgi:adenosylhomocysteine nucleosidase